MKFSQPIDQILSRCQAGAVPATILLWMTLPAPPAALSNGSENLSVRALCKDKPDKHWHTRSECHRHNLSNLCVGQPGGSPLESYPDLVPVRHVLGGLRPSWPVVSVSREPVPAPSSPPLGLWAGSAAHRLHLELGWKSLLKAFCPPVGWAALACWPWSGQFQFPYWRPCVGSSALVLVSILPWLGPSALLMDLRSG